VGAASERKEKHDAEGGGGIRPAAGDITLLKWGSGAQWRGSVEVERRVEGHEEGGLAPIGGGQLGRRGNGPVTARAGGAGSLTSGVRLAVGGRGRERCGTRVGRPGKEMEWGESGENVKAGSG
jgi:hypothetical protein